MLIKITDGIDSLEFNGNIMEVLCTIFSNKNIEKYNSKDLIISNNKGSKEYYTFFNDRDYLIRILLSVN
jgi:hypothetical protein